MAYLVKDDYTLHISIDHLDQILDQAMTSSGKTADQIRTEAEETAKAEITSYLSAKYEIENEFDIDGSSAPNDRNRLIKKCMIDISLYHIYFTVVARDIPESRQLLYERCVDMLKQYRDAELDFGLPIKDTDGDGVPNVSRVRLKSKQKFISRPFTDLSLMNNEDD